MKKNHVILLVFLFSLVTYAQDLPIPKSSLITKLEADVAGGKTSAVDDFWKIAKSNTTPLIESIENDSQNSLVTFIWQGDAETKNVLVQSPFYAWVMAKRQMTRIGNTDVWYKTAKVPNDARFTYRFSVNDPRLPFGDPYDWYQFKVPLFNDPLGKKQFTYIKDDDFPEDETVSLSLLEMPAVFKSSYAVADQNIKKGKLEKLNFKSEKLANERRLWFYTPPGYSAKKKYPLVVFLDGIDYLSHIPAPTILDNLIAAGKIPPIVAVFVATPIEAGIREKEYFANPLFNDFMTQELLPLIHSKYSVSSKPENTTIVGLSASGLAAGFLALKHSKNFGNVIMQSASLWWGKDYYGADGEWLTNEYIKSPKLNVRFYVEVGKMEVFPSTRKGMPNQFHANRHFRDILQLKGYKVFYNEFYGAHEHINWRETLPDALIKILGK